jgi:hypothetical protein
MTSAVVSTPTRKPLRNFRATNYSPEQKQTWYSFDRDYKGEEKKEEEESAERKRKELERIQKTYNLSPETAAKFCRCILETNTSSLLNSSTTTRRKSYNPYAVCNSSISKSSSTDNGQRVSSSDLATFSLNGECGKHANFSKIPTEILYAFVMTRLKSGRSRSLAKNSSQVSTLLEKLPSLETFLQTEDIEVYRPTILQLVHQLRF